MSRLELTGVIYPQPIGQRSWIKSLGHQCEEFTKAEIDDLIRRLLGWRFASSTTWTNFGHVIGRENPRQCSASETVVNASTAAGKRLFNKSSRKNGWFVLSHVYEFNVDRYSEKDRQLRIAMNQGDSWRLQTERVVCKKLARAQCLRTAGGWL